MDSDRVERLEDSPRPLGAQPFFLKRRDFLKSVSAGALAIPGIAGPFGRLVQQQANANGSGGASGQDAAGAVVGDGVTSPDHFVPTDKKLDPKWVKALFEKGEPTAYAWMPRPCVAMPVGGIGSGQMYVGHGGTLRHWEIFNRRAFSGWGQDNYEQKEPKALVEHSIRAGLHSRDANKSDGHQLVVPHAIPLGSGPFVGQHPVATFSTIDDAVVEGEKLAVETRLEVFAPFVPTNAFDSTLPVSFFRATITNRGKKPVLLSVHTRLENASAPDTGDLFAGVRTMKVEHGDFGSLVELRIDSPVDTTKQPAPPIVFADFEGTDYGTWKVEGEAFGVAPSKGTEPTQNPVTGFQGHGLVNSYRGSDALTGKLTSPPFKVERRFVNFLIGGGSHPNETCVNLVIDGKVVASATGRNDERLAWAYFDVAAHYGKQATLEIVDSRKDGWGHVNVDQIEFADTPRVGNGGPLESQSDYGQLGLLLCERAGDVVDSSAERTADRPTAAPSDKVPSDDARNAGKSTERPRAIAVQEVTLAPNESKTFTSALVWHFPNAEHGHWYSSRFASWRELALYVSKERERLIGDTLAWRDAYYGGSLPNWLLERLHAPVSNLQTNVTQVWKNGRFWAWEGVGCCEGTCTHVWNYEHATGRLFPELARSTREMQDLGEGFHPDGLVGYRGVDVYAADGQCGTVLKCWREHLMSADDGFLKRNWPKIRKVVEYLLRRDGNDDGLLEDDQHNTYDIQFFGANTFVGSLYLAALRAAEEMAKLCGEPDFAARCHHVFESGSKLTLERLWNGEYFVQQVDLAKHPKDQYADGCLADQMFGQGWARQVGLGNLYPQEKVVSALRSIWKYCWAPDVGPQSMHHLPERYFARAGQAGMFVCTWPKSKHMGNEGVRYRDEVWTGCEYQVAGHMIWEGLVEEGLAIVRGIHERYDGRIRNPWNEVECGDHYARAMASWGVYLALLGFEYDGPAGVLGFAPRVKPDAFSAAFTAAEGFGVLRQQREPGLQKNELELVRGRLRLRELRVELAESASAGLADVRVDVALRSIVRPATPADPSKPKPPVQPRVVAIGAKTRRDGRRLFVTFDQEQRLEASDQLEVTIHHAT
jgi:uncharacterized protein (DUF608 family)